MSTYSDLILSETGLISYWRLGENPTGTGGGGTAVDEVGANNGIYTGNLLTYGEVGALVNDADTAILFPANSNDYVLAKSGTILSGLTNATVEAWVKTTNTTNDINVWVERASSGNDAWELYLTDDGKIGIYISNDAGSNTFPTEKGTGANDGDYHHVVITKAGTVLKAYLDGVQVGTDGAWGGTESFTDSGIETRIGGNKGNANGRFDGTIDDVAIYSVALSATQVFNHYVTGSISAPALPFQTVERPRWPYSLNQPSAQARSLVLWWPGHPYTSTGIRDLSRKWINDTARLASSEMPSATAGVFDKAYSQDGSHKWGSGVINGLNGTRTAHSISGWFYVPDAGGGALLGWGQDSPVNSGMSLSLSSNLIVRDDTFLGAGTVVSGAVPVTFPGWFHVCYTFDGTTSRVYLNGQEVANSVTVTTTASVTHVYVNRNMHAGFASYSSVGTLSLDIRFYNYCLPPGIVAAMYRPRTRWELYLQPIHRQWKGARFIAPPAVQTATPQAATVTLTEATLTATGVGTATAIPEAAQTGVTGVAVLATPAGSVTATPLAAIVQIFATEVSARVSAQIVTVGTATVTLTAIPLTASPTGAAPVIPLVATVSIFGTEITASVGPATVIVGTAEVTITGIDLVASSFGTATVILDVATVTITAIPLQATSPPGMTPGKGGGSSGGLIAGFVTEVVQRRCDCICPGAVCTDEECQEVCELLRLLRFTKRDLPKPDRDKAHVVLRTLDAEYVDAAPWGDVWQEFVTPGLPVPIDTGWQLERIPLRKGETPDFMPLLNAETSDDNTANNGNDMNSSNGDRCDGTDSDGWLPIPLKSDAVSE